jgi:hypothetical protein
VALVRTDVSEERITPIIRVKRICELETTLELLVTANVVPSSPILFALMMEAMFLLNVDSFKSHTASYPRRQYS